MWNYRILILVLLLNLNQGQKNTTYNLTDPLKVIITSNENGLVMRAVTHESDPNENGSQVFLCPKRSAQPSQSTSELETPEHECLVKIDSPSPCFEKFEPKFQLESERCGSEKQGSLYSIKYDLCLVKKGPTETKSDNSLSIKLPSSDTVYDIESDASPSQLDTTIEPKLPMILYSVCFDDAKMETLYTTHRILVNEEIRVPIPGVPDLTREIITYQPEGSEKQARDFNSFNQWHSENKYNNDFLVPRPYVPGHDIDPSWMRDMHLHSLNIGLAWSNKNIKWYRINKAITKNVKNPQAEIYTSTSELLKIDNRDWVFVVNEGILTIRAYFMLWKLITIPSDRGYLGFIVVFYNVPLGYPLTTMKPKYLCPESICSEINFDIKEDYFIQCCPATKSILDHLGYQGGKEIVDKLILPEN